MLRCRNETIRLFLAKRFDTGGKMNNQSLYKLCVLGAIFSFLPFFCFVPFAVRVCGCQASGLLQLGKGFDGEVMKFVRG